jgi:hypothetical protein
VSLSPQDAAYRSYTSIGVSRLDLPQRPHPEARGDDTGALTANGQVQVPREARGGRAGVAVAGQDDWVRTSVDIYRWCCSRPQVIVLSVCGIWVVLWFMFLYSITNTADSPALRRRLLGFASEGATFVRIREYKQCLGFLADVMEFVPHAGRCQGAHWPDFFGQAHHEGVILEAVAGEASHFLHMEFAKEGLSWSVQDHYPSLDNLLPMGAPGPWRERRIDQFNGDPSRLAVFLKQISGWRYNLVTFNCNTFADIIFDFYASGDYSTIAAAGRGQDTIAAVPPASAQIDYHSKFGSTGSMFRGATLDADAGARIGPEPEESVAGHHLVVAGAAVATERE